MYHRFMSEADEEHDEIGGAVPRKFWQKTWVWIIGSMLLFAGLVALLFFDVSGFIAGETDLFGNYRFEEEQQVARAGMTPMERVHAETFPRWLIAEANRWSNAQERFDELRSAITDEELGEVLDELKASIDSGEITNPPQVIRFRLRDHDTGVDAGSIADVEEPPPTYPHVELLRRWNERLEELGEPFYVTGSISGTSGGPALVAEFYRRLADPSVRVGEQEYPTVILQRIDRTNVVEAYLGVAHRGGIAVVVTDRILDLATDEVWLMLNPLTSPGGELAEAYAAAIRSEAKSALGPQVFTALTRSAAERRRLLETVDAVLERRSCGNTMQFGVLAWDGLNPRDLDRLDAYAERDKIQPCPTVKFEEVDALREASEALQSEQTKQALETLVAWLTRSVALHEARHVADELELGRLEVPESCPGCPERMHPSTRAELSAYVASIAWSDSPATTLYQACTVRVGPHARAMRFFNAEMGRTCADPPPTDLVERTRELQGSLFGVATPMELPETFPARLEIHRFR